MFARVVLCVCTQHTLNDVELSHRSSETVSDDNSTVTAADVFQIRG